MAFLVCIAEHTYNTTSELTLAACTLNAWIECDWRNRARPCGADICAKRIVPYAPMRHIQFNRLLKSSIFETRQLSRASKSFLKLLRDFSFDLRAACVRVDRDLVLSLVHSRVMGCFYNVLSPRRSFTTQLDFQFIAKDFENSKRVSVMLIKFESQGPGLTFL